MAKRERRAKSANSKRSSDPEIPAANEQTRNEETATDRGCDSMPSAEEISRLSQDLACLAELVDANGVGSGKGDWSCPAVFDAWRACRNQFLHLRHTLYRLPGHRRDGRFGARVFRSPELFTGDEKVLDDHLNGTFRWLIRVFNAKNAMRGHLPYRRREISSHLRSLSKNLGKTAARREREP